jgi:hypothetical protein
MGERADFWRRSRHRPLDNDSLDFIERDLVLAPVVELRRSRAFVVGDVLTRHRNEAVVGVLPCQEICFMLVQTGLFTQENYSEGGGEHKPFLEIEGIGLIVENQLSASQERE